MFGLQSVLGISQRTDPRQDSGSSASSKLSLDSKTSELTSRGSTFSFLSRSSKGSSVEPSFEVSCEAAIRPSFCWNSHQDTWQAGGVWSQFESGLKSCQVNVSACANFMGHKDAAFAGVFDGHGFSGRSAATYACKNITKWLSVDSNAMSKDPKKRAKALERVCGQIHRGLARQELCGFDASSSGLTACLAILQANSICLASMGTCRAVLGRIDPKCSSRLRAVCLTSSDSIHPRSTSETPARVSGHGVRPMQSMPAPSPFATICNPQAQPPEGLLGRGPLGELPSVPPLMTVHQLSMQDQFVVLGTSGLWEVMTAQQAVDFVHQCRHCRPDTLSCSQALTLEAHTRWKFKFSKVIAEDVAAVIIHCGAVPQPAQPGHSLPAFPDAATSNHAANDTHILHETREFWGRLQPQSLVPLLQSASSKGKGRMPSAYLPVATSPSASNAKGQLPSTHLPIQRPSPSQSFPSEPSQSGGWTASSSFSGLQDSLLANGSTASAPRQEGSGHSSFARGASVGGRSVHFASPLQADSSDDSNAGQARTSDPEVNLHSSRDKQAFGREQQCVSRVSVETRVSKCSPPVDISFRPDTPDVSTDHTPRIVSSSGRSSVLSHESQEPGPPSSSSPFGFSPSPSMQTPSAHPPLSTNPFAPNPFAAAAMMPARSSTDLSDVESDVCSTPRSSFDRQDPWHSGHTSSTRRTGAVSKSPRAVSKSLRAHAQQPLDESEGAKPLLAKLTMMERTHSAPGGVPFGMLVDLAVGAPRPRIRLPVSIPEDRPVAAAVPVEAADSVTRPFRKIYPHGSEGELDTLEADVPETSPQLLPPTLTLESNPNTHSSGPNEGRVHSKAYPTSSQLRSGASLPRVEFPKVHAAVFSAPDWAGEKMEGQMRGGFPRISSHPENLADLAAATAAIDTPFARYPLQSVYAQPYHAGSSAPSSWQPFLIRSNLVNGTSSSTASSIDPWASPTQHSGASLKSRRSSALGNRSRNSSAAFDELTRLRSKRSSGVSIPEPVPISCSM